LALIVAFSAGRFADGQPVTSPWAQGFWAGPIAVLLFGIGGPLIAVFRKRAPFGALPCALFGAACGMLAFSVIAVGLSDVDDYAYFESEGLLFEYYIGFVQLVGVGTMAGLAGGLTFWSICRMGSRSTE
jgi:hypothetical protein